uniref:Uncharacterized protein n=1 Tax=Rhizophora mucronata TaxID=61149 RepID=A0A2P2PV05_RHIMU
MWKLILCVAPSISYFSLQFIFILGKYKVHSSAFYEDIVLINY